jgi:hypothetical protein
MVCSFVCEFDGANEKRPLVGGRFLDTYFKSLISSMTGSNN